MLRDMFLIAAAAVCAFTSTPCSAAGANSPNTAAITTFIAEMEDSPYNRSLKDCFQAQPVEGFKFILPDVSEKPELLALIICASSIDADEKQYWLDTLPAMNREQKEQLWDMLATERRREVDPVLRGLSLIEQGF